jgi:hypothetical protein
VEDEKYRQKTETYQCNLGTNSCKKLYNVWKHRLADGTYTQEEFDNKWNSYYSDYYRWYENIWYRYNLQHCLPDGTLSEM